MALFLVDRFKNSDYFAMLDEVCPELAQCGGKRLHCRVSKAGARRGARAAGSRRRRHLAADALSGGANLPDEKLFELENSLGPYDAINIQYTSGTTGFPKAATLSHRNLLLNAYYVGQCQKLTADDRICIPVPFYHCFGCVLGTLCCGGARRGDDRAGRVVSTRRHARSHRTGAGHRPLWRADDVHRPVARSDASRGAIYRRCERASWPAAPARSR